LRETVKKVIIVRLSSGDQVPTGNETF